MILWGPFALFVAGGAVLGLRYGYLAATTSETDMIARYAARYVETRAQAGDQTAQLTDCLAYPGAERGIWIVVICGGTGGRFEYHVNRIGGLVHMTAPGAGRALGIGRPQT